VSVGIFVPLVDSIITLMHRLRVSKGADNAILFLLKKSFYGQQKKRQSGG
jgi:hypothetical protein